MAQASVKKRLPSGDLIFVLTTNNDNFLRESRIATVAVRTGEKGVIKEVLQVARAPKEMTVKITHHYVHNPEAVQRGLDLWATYLARHLAKRLKDAAQPRRQGTA